MENHKETRHTFPIAGGVHPRFRAMELSKVMRSLAFYETLMLFTGAERFFAPNFG